MEPIQSFTLIFGSIISLFGLSLILVPTFWKGIGKGIGDVSAATNNLRAKVVGLDKKVKFTGANPKYTPSKKGMNGVGIFFIIFGILIILIPYF